MDNKTSWSTEDLQQLINPLNHRVRFDGYGFIWEHKLDGEWSLHSVYKYREYKYYVHLIHFHTSSWKSELDQRIREATIEGLREIKKRGKVLKKVAEVTSYSDMKTEDKVKLISELLPDESQAYIAEVLNVSRATVNRHLK